MTTEQQPPTEPEPTDVAADQADAPVLGIGDDVRPGPATTDEPKPGAPEPTDCPAPGPHTSRLTGTKVPKSRPTLDPRPVTP